MPQVGIAVGVAALAGAAAVAVEAAIIGTLATLTLSAVLSGALVGAVGAALSVGASMIFGQDPPSPGSLDFSSRTLMVRQPVVSRRIVYGKTRTSGPILFMGTTGNEKYLHIVIAVASHEVEAIDEVYFDDQLAWTPGGGVQGRFVGKARVNVHLGAVDQAADADLVTEIGDWTENHRLQGVAYVYARLEFDSDIYPAGIPNVSVVERGRKIYDPRTATVAYSANAALCLRDYLLDANLGLGITAAEIDDDAVIAAANICDEAIPLSAGGTENRYEVNGVVDTAAAPRQVIEALLTAFAGRMIYTVGKFTMYAGAYRTPTVTLTEDDLAGPIQVRTRRSRRDLYNAVKGVFVSAADNYVEADFPPVTSAAFKAADGNETIYREMELPFTTSVTMAQRIGKVKLHQSRQQKTATLTCKLTALRIQPGDSIMLDNDRMGWSGKVFDVMGFSFGIGRDGALGVELVIQETASEIYDWDSSEEQDFIAGLGNSLPSPFDPPAPGLTLSDRLRATPSSLVTVLTADVTSSAGYQQGFEVQARKSGETEWVALGQATANRYELANVEDGSTYDVRARVVNTLGIRSAWTEKTRVIIGKTAPPSDVTGFTINIVGAEAHLSWDPVADLDLSHYKIRHSPLSSGVTFAQAIDLIPKVAKPATSVSFPALPGTYFIKAVDVLGISSTTAAAAATNVDAIAGLNAVATTPQETAFSGTKTGTEVDATALVLDAATNLLLRSQEFDNATWSKTRASVAADAATDPDGNTAADKLIEDSSTGSHFARQTPTLVGSTTYVISVYAKAAERSRVAIFPNGAGWSDTGVVVFDLALGIVESNGSGEEAGVETIGAGWYRCYAYRTTAASGSTPIHFHTVNGGLSYTGDGTSGIYIWGAQCEEEKTHASYPTRYIETTAATADGDYIPEGEYEFDNPVDLTAVYTARLTVDIEITRFEASGLLFDAAGGLFDDREGLFDGDTSDFDDVNVELFVATTNDDPGGSPTWSAWRKFFVGDYTARGFKFKVKMTTTTPSATPRITALGVNVDMPDRVYAVADIASGTAAGGKVVTFSPAFKAAPTIVITPQDLATGDYYEIVSKTATAATVRFKNSAGTVVDRTFDLVAKGYGEAI